MKHAEATAYPRKRFFLEMFTRDISLEDCLLDLVDNSLDSLIRHSKRDPIRGLLRVEQPTRPRDTLPTITLNVTPRKIVVWDNCGGISSADAVNDVFNFGHSIDPSGRLGAYGIGLKRALFKIAEQVSIASQTNKDAFAVDLDVGEWAARDSGSLGDWTIPIKLELAVDAPGTTTITFDTLREEVRMRLSDSSFIGLLSRAIGRTYAFFLDRLVTIRLNGKHVEPEEVALAQSQEVKPARKVIRDTRSGVDIELLASLAPHEQWAAEKAGWYVLCNGRVVLAADKTDLTGWGAGLPNFHTKFRGFVGLAFFEATNPLALPWTTTKHGLNKESPVYQDALREMVLLTRPLITFFDSLYPSEAPESLAGRDIVRGISQASVAEIRAKPQGDFAVKPTRTRASSTVKIQYDALKADVDRIRKQIRSPKASAGNIGLLTFEHYLKTECP